MFVSRVRHCRNKPTHKPNKHFNGHMLPIACPMNSILMCDVVFFSPSLLWSLQATCELFLASADFFYFCAFYCLFFSLLHQVDTVIFDFIISTFLLFITQCSFCAEHLSRTDGQCPTGAIVETQEWPQNTVLEISQFNVCFAVKFIALLQTL